MNGDGQSKSGLQPPSKPIRPVNRQQDTQQGGGQQTQQQAQAQQQQQQPQSPSTPGKTVKPQTTQSQTTHSQTTTQSPSQAHSLDDLLPSVPTSAFFEAPPAAYVRVKSVEKQPTTTTGGGGGGVSRDELAAFGWEEVTASDGRVYYYHKITRVSRWDRPDFTVMEAVDARIKESQSQIDEAVQRRKAEREVIKSQEAEKAAVSEQLKIKIKTAIEKWRCLPNNRTAGIIEMLSTLDKILPTCIPQGFLTLNAANAAPSDVRKGYMRAVRLIHPDKLSPDLDLESKILAESVFICITENFDAYRKAHGV